MFTTERRFECTIIEFYGFRGWLRRLTVFTIELLIGFTLMIGFLEEKQHKPHFIIIYKLIRNV